MNRSFMVMFYHLEHQNVNEHSNNRQEETCRRTADDLSELYNDSAGSEL